MIEAHVINKTNRHLYAKDFWDEYFRLRHQIYVIEKRWREGDENGHERDEFDNDNATYIIGLDGSRIVAGARLLPTHLPNLVSEHFAHMCEEKGVPYRPDWADWTRMFVVPDGRSSSRRGLLTQICAAAMQYCVEEGISYAGGIQELYFLPQWSLYRWRLVPMGLPQKVAGEWAIVGYLQTDSQALASIRRVLGSEQDLLVRRGLQQPFVDHRVNAS
ncbi:MAG: acyl-homoserine-lactone synthase [Neoaquamicrobium sediminum]|uniref:acyl-homoserine-lactone synthase n=1 Tax=Neoaquamicrobium sediminum TaxID=1849104 RepID=UPI0040353263